MQHTHLVFITEQNVQFTTSPNYITDLITHKHYTVKKITALLIYS